MRNLLVEMDANGIRVSRITQTREEIDYIHDPVLHCWLEVLVQGRSFGDAIKAITEQAELAQKDAKGKPA